ncbi:MAG TPA: SPOR domain-containing protein [Chitinophagaceae bacterium]|nr:SPOR domain-containing protein [Chitinophagaceae bacterium]
MNWIKILFSVSILFFTKISFANDTIIIHKDARLDLLTQKQIQINKHAAMLTGNGLYKGFRVQVISLSNRDEAFKIKADVLAKFPDQKSYIIFQAPNYKIRIGNFLKREDAENYRKQITNSFSQEIYVVEDAIEYTPKSNEEINQ